MCVSYRPSHSSTEANQAEAILKGTLLLRADGKDKKYRLRDGRQFPEGGVIEDQVEKALPE